jgi:programmed cell death protein 5
MSDLDDIRRKRMQELQQQAAQQQMQQGQSAADMQAQAQMQQQMEMQKRQALMQILTPEARSRLTNIRLTKPEFVEQLELQLIQLAQMGRIQNKITDEQLKVLLRKMMSEQKKEINITFK